MGAFGFANDAKTQLIDYAVRLGSNQTGVRAELQVLGKVGTPNSPRLYRGLKEKGDFIAIGSFFCRNYLKEKSLNLLSK